MNTGRLIILAGIAILFADVASQFFRAWTSDASFAFGMIAVVMIAGGAGYSAINEL